mmetsp:Transcript_30519/g.58761  ORF Transcript_30519/g.58761 Transcript_30519/m.58761 type:complete len:832 (-) Transcript_30519:112-2607(-)
MTTTKRTYKLQQFAAHAGPVNCLRVGRKSAGVMVTGGEDKKVNMWAIGKPSVILSLTGHQSPVECVTFDSAEENVVAGASNGTLKLWDLEEAKVVRTLTGHRSNCMGVDFHPFGEFFASGSLDTNLKIWDIRRKGCIQTYKGHTAGVSHVRFSPDGKWVVSGSEDSTIKLWDLTAGKQLHEFKLHEGPIRAMEFHPTEFLLATGSQDRTCKLWDLEKFELVGNMVDSTAIQAVAFSSDGAHVIAATQDHVKAFGWEPSRCVDYVDVGWSRVGDLAVHENKLLGCAMHQTLVSVWVVDLTRTPGELQPGQYHDPGRAEALPDPTLGRPRTQCGSGSPSAMAERGNLPRFTAPATTFDRDDPDSPMADVGRRLRDPNEKRIQSNYEEPCPLPRGGQPNRPPPATANPSSYQPTWQVYGMPGEGGPPPTAPDMSMASAAPVPPTNQARGIRTRSQSPNLGPPAMHVSEDPSPSAVSCMVDVATGMSDTLMKGAFDMKMLRSAAEELSKAEAQSGDDPVTRPISRGGSAGRNLDPSSAGSGLDDAPLVTRSRPGSASKWGGARQRSGGVGADDWSERRLSRGGEPDPAARAVLSPAPSARQARELSPTSPYARARPSEPFRDQACGAAASPGTLGLGLDMNSFMPAALAKGASGGGSGTTRREEHEMIDRMMAPHSTLTAILSTRMVNLQAVRMFWSRNDTRGTIEALRKAGESSVVVDFLEATEESPDFFTLEAAAGILPLLGELLESEHSKYVTTAIQVAKKLIVAFRDLIQSTRSASPAVGIDLTAETRLERCSMCYRSLQSFRPRLDALSGRGGDVAGRARDLLAAIETIG